jgi:hypothetical protein
VKDQGVVLNLLFLHAQFVVNEGKLLQGFEL